MEKEFEIILSMLKEYKHKNGEINYLNDLEYINSSDFFNVCVKNKVINIINEVLEMKGINPLINKGETRNVTKLYSARFSMSKDIMNEFEKQNINYAVLKGAYLADLAYGDRELRSSNDIDILINKHDIKKVKEICLSKGFVFGKSDRVKNKIQKYDRMQEIAFSLNTHQIATMVKVGKNADFDFYDTVLDINFNLTWGEYKGVDINVSEFLDNAITIKDSSNFTYRVLAGEEFFIQLCLHLYKEANGLFFVKNSNGLVLRAFLDIYYYIFEQSKNLSMLKIQEIISKYQLENYIYYVLIYIKILFDSNEWMEELISYLEKNSNVKDVVNFFGLEKQKSWEDITIKERFYSNKVKSFLDKMISNEEFEKIKLATVEFY